MCSQPKIVGCFFHGFSVPYFSNLDLNGKSFSPDRLLPACATHVSNQLQSRAGCVVTCTRCKLCFQLILCVSLNFSQGVQGWMVLLEMCWNVLVSGDGDEAWNSFACWSYKTLPSRRKVIGKTSLDIEKVIWGILYYDPTSLLKNLQFASEGAGHGVFTDFGRAPGCPLPLPFAKSRWKMTSKWWHYYACTLIVSKELASKRRQHMKYSWFVFALIQKVESFWSWSSGYTKHMEIVPAALPKGLMLTFFWSDKRVFFLSPLERERKKKSNFHI